MSITTDIGPGDQVSLEISESPDPVTGTVTRVYRDAIDQECADIRLGSGEIRPQCTRFLTLLRKADTQRAHPVVDRALVDLMPQLRDVLHLPEDLDLPRLARISCTAYQDEPGWSVQAMLSHTGKTDLELWDGLRAWVSGAVPRLGAPAPSSLQPSGMYRKASVTITVAEVSVEIWAAVDAMFQVPGDAPAGGAR